MAASTFVLENGAFTAKCGYTNQNEPRIVPNCITKAKSERRRQFIGDQIDDCKDYSGIFYILPFQKGYLVNFDVQKTVWDYVFGKDVFNVSFTDTNCIVTEPYFNFESIQETMVEIFFEEYRFNGLYRTNPATLSAYKNSLERKNELCCLVVDSGYSFTHIIPYSQGKKVKSGILRIDVGGKLLTNHLKEIISYRQLHVMDETYVMNQVKEDVCYVSMDFYKDMQAARQKGQENTIARDYVLPDYSVIKRGYVKSVDDSENKTSGEQVIRMCNERISVPEILFHPSDIGIHQMGIPEAVVHSISLTPPELHPHLYKNIVLTGGNCFFPGFKERMYKEIRSLAPDLYDVNIVLPPSPSTYAWKGGVDFSHAKDFNQKLVTRKQYEEIGFGCCDDKFDI